MKSKISFFMLALMGWASALAIELNRADMEFKADRAVQGLLGAKHSPRNGIQCWAGRIKKNGVSDGVVEAGRFVGGIFDGGDETDTIPVS